MLKPKMTVAKVVSVPLYMYNLLWLNWYLLGVEIPHKTRLWYLLGVLSKFSDKHPRHFYRGVTSNTFFKSFPNICVCYLTKCNKQQEKYCVSREKTVY